VRRHFPLQQDGWLKDVFEGLDAKSRQALMAAAAVHELEPLERLPSIPNCIVRVEEGLVKMAVTSGDRNLIVGLFGPGDTIVSPLFHPWEERIYFIEAQEESELYVIPQKAVLEVAEKNPQFGQNLMQQLSWGIWHQMNVLHMLSFYNLPQRVAQVLVNLSAMVGFPDQKGGTRLGLRFTQEELAELAGARRETLSTVLQQFREDGILDLRYARIDIKDPDALQALAGTPPLPFLKRNEGKPKK
jgi:CRP-like cAMP-binding protein